MNAPLSVITTAQLFDNARTHSHWQPRAIEPHLLQQLYELTKWGPTSMNAQPARFVFVQSAEGKERLRPALMAGNVDKTMSAPLTVIVAHDASDLVLTVADDGAGIPSSAAERGGLRGMRERAELAGGSLTINSGPRGTTVVARLPWEGAA